MADFTGNFLICSCDDTMPLDAGAVRRGCRGELTTATQLCRAELGRFRTIAAEDAPLTVGCTQEVSRFSRSCSGKWTRQPDQLCQYPGDRRVVRRSCPGRAENGCPARSGGRARAAGAINFIGERRRHSHLRRDEKTVEAGNLLKDHLDVTVLIKPPANIVPPRVADFSGGERKNQEGQRPSRRIRGHGRRFRGGCTVLARRTGVRAIAQSMRARTATSFLT